MSWEKEQERRSSTNKSEALKVSGKTIGEERLKVETKTKLPANTNVKAKNTKQKYSRGRYKYMHM